MAIQKITAKIIADGAIIATDIADGSITTAKIADANVTAAKLATGAALPSQSGNTNYYLTTDGTNSVWKAQTALAVANTQVTGSIEATQVGTTVSQLFGMRNRIINGDMRIDQRNAGTSVTAVDAQYTVDRFAAGVSQTGKLTWQQNAGSVTPPAGFTNYLGITSTSAYSSLSTDYFIIIHKVEGFNVIDLAWGTANARTVTLSFWVRSSLTGTFGGALRNSATNRGYGFNYTISAANTWEQKTITIPGDTTGTWLTNSGIGIEIDINLGTGSTYCVAAGTWSAGNYVSATGSQSVVGTNGATFYITGVQLEVGSTATPFERRMITTELQLCQRYFEKSYNQGTAIAAPTQTGMILMVPVLNVGSNTYTQAIYYKVSKRATPTVTPYAYNGTSGQWNTGVIGTNEQLGNATVDASSENKFGLVIAFTVTPNGAYGQFAASAEL